MALRLNGSSSGYVELDVPAAAGSHTLTLPDGGGSSGQYLQTNGSGGLSWQTVAPALFESYAIIGDQKTSGTQGGTFTSGDWRTRDLNTEFADPDGIVSISSNQFTLQAGTYKIEWRAPAAGCNENKTRLYNITDSSVDSFGSSNYNYNSGSFLTGTFFSVGSVRITLAAAKAFEIQHRCGYTRTTNGFGISTSYDSEIYTVVNIYKEA
jgi:hypothetical protein